MDYGKGQKAEIALKIAAALAYLSVCEMDRVSVYYIKNNKVHEVMNNIVGKEAFYNSIGKLNEIEFSEDCFISDGILPTAVGYGDGMSIILSDFLTDNDYEQAIDYLKQEEIIAFDYELNCNTLYLDLSVKENLELMCGIHGFSKEKTTVTSRV